MSLGLKEENRCLRILSSPSRNTPKAVRCEKTRNRIESLSQDILPRGGDDISLDLQKKILSGIFRILPGGSLAETCRITGLSKEKLLELHIVDLGAGASSTAAELAAYRAQTEPESAAAEGSYIAVDLIYQLEKQVLELELSRHFKELPRQLEEHKASLVWQDVYNSKFKCFFKSRDHYTAYRQLCTKIFLRDYEQGLADGRYIFGVAPGLQFLREADLVLMHNLLSEQKPVELQRQIIENCLNFAKKIIIFPAPTNAHGQLKPSIQEIINQLRRSRAVDCKIRETDYEFRKGAFHRLEISRK